MSSVNSAGPLSERAGLASGSKTRDQQQPCCVRHVPPHIITTDARSYHVGLRVPLGIVDPIEGHPQLRLSAVRAWRRDHRCHEWLSELGARPVGPIRSLRVLDDDLRQQAEVARLPGTLFPVFLHVDPGGIEPPSKNLQMIDPTSVAATRGVVQRATLSFPEPWAAPCLGAPRVLVWIRLLEVLAGPHSLSAYAAARISPCAAAIIHAGSSTLSLAFRFWPVFLRGD